MASGGYRPGAGRPKATKQSVKKSGDDAEAPDTEIVTGKTFPLEYMLRVMNDIDADESRRDRMAIAAAPFVHPKLDINGKKDERKSAASKASEGKFSVSKAPLKLVGR